RTADDLSSAPAPSGDAHAMAPHEGRLLVYDAATGKEQRHFNGHNGPVFSLALSPDGKLLASGGGDERDIPGPPRDKPARKDTSVRLWRTATGEEVFRLTGHLTSVHAVQFT